FAGGRRCGPGDNRGGGVCLDYHPHYQLFPDDVAGRTGGAPGRMIETRDLKRKFGSQTILDGVNIQIESGESAVIIGRSGGGKSVLMKPLIGLLQPDTGTVVVDGENIERMT